MFSALPASPTQVRQQSSTRFFQVNLMQAFTDQIYTRRYLLVTSMKHGKMHSKERVGIPGTLRNELKPYGSAVHSVNFRLSPWIMHVGAVSNFNTIAEFHFSESSIDSFSCPDVRRNTCAWNEEHIERPCFDCPPQTQQTTAYWPLSSVLTFQNKSLRTYVMCWQFAACRPS